MSAKHTPGPWIVLPAEDDAAYIRIRGTRLGCRFKVANALFVAGPPAEKAEAIANAHLIAAAPELLAELKRLLAAYRTAVKLGYSEGDAYTTGPHNAIARAEWGVL